MYVLCRLKLRYSLTKNAAYKKEDCQPDWCFTAAVNKYLPSEFFSYPQYPSIDVAEAFVKLDSVILPRMSQKLARLPEERMSTSTDEVSKPRSPRRRFEVVHLERDSGNSTESLALRQSNAQGYLDGFRAAKIFANYDLSMLGFTGQYMNKRILELGPDMIQPGTESVYKVRFQQGLAEAQTLISSTMKLDPPVQILHKVHASSTSRFELLHYKLPWILGMSGLALAL